MIEVREFIARLEQGWTDAFLCRAADGHAYVVKSIQAGREGLIREVIAARVGHALGLPIPPFDLLFAASWVANQSLNPELVYLAKEPGFGSRFIEALAALNVSDVLKIDVSIRRRVLLFDWWLFNEDRTDDNPNLLWDVSTQKLHVIDHNLAFGIDLHQPATIQVFWDHHIFRSSRASLTEPSFRTEMSGVMEGVLRAVPNWWSLLPDEWTIPSSITLEFVMDTLGRCRSNQFWATT